MRPKSSLGTFLALAGSAMLQVNSANATQFWDGGGGDAKWSTPGNWGGDALPDFATAINFGSLSSVAGTAFGNVVVPPQTTAQNDLAAGTLIVGIRFGNNGQANRTDAYTLQGNSIAFGNATNQTIGTTALHGAAIVSSIEDVVSLNMDLGSPGSGQNRQFEALSNHHLKIDGVISGGANAILLARTTNSILTLANANNSYLGLTNIAEGYTGAFESVVQITSIANGGLNSSIGASSNAASNLRFNSGFNDTSMTTLRYIGGANASTDRLFSLYGNITGTNSRIESSGAGTLSFTNTGAITSSHQKARNFYLGGTNTGNNTFAPTLSDFTEVSTFTKQGVGKWIITGDHTYTGATNVEEGTLLINGSTSTTSVVSVAANATLGGTGTIGGSVNVSADGILSPGASIESLAAGSLSMASGSTFAYEVANSGTSGADLLAVGGAISLTGVNLSFNLTTLAALTGGGWTIGDKITLISYLGGDITSGFSGYADDTPYSFGSNEWLFDYNDTVAGGNYGTDAIAASQNRFVTMTVTAIPEPGAALLGGLGLLALLRRRRS